MKWCLLFIWSSIACGCTSSAPTEHFPAYALPAADTLLRLPAGQTVYLHQTLQQHFDTLPDSAFVELIRWDSTFILDVRYATPHNFMQKAVYPCPRVLLRKVVAEALIKAHQEAQQQGYRIKIFDGYRPRSVQWLLWNATDKKQYVADPRYGSKHNRGAAVDLTLVNARTLVPLDMGTDYDFFGKKAHHTYPHLPDSVLRNRLILKQIMLRHGFSPIRSEWWHYNFKQQFSLSDQPLPCTE